MSAPHRTLFIVVMLAAASGCSSDPAARKQRFMELATKYFDRGKYEVYVWTRGYRPYASSEVRVEKSRPVRLFVRLRSGN